MHTNTELSLSMVLTAPTTWRDSLWNLRKFGFKLWTALQTLVLVIEHYFADDTDLFDQRDLFIQAPLPAFGDSSEEDFVEEEEEEEYEEPEEVWIPEDNNNFRSEIEFVKWLRRRIAEMEASSEPEYNSDEPDEPESDEAGMNWSDENNNNNPRCRNYYSELDYSSDDENEYDPNGRFEGRQLRRWRSLQNIPMQLEDSIEIATREVFRWSSDPDETDATEENDETDSWITISTGSDVVEHAEEEVSKDAAIVDVLEDEAAEEVLEDEAAEEVLEDEAVEDEGRGVFFDYRNMLEIVEYEADDDC